MSSNSSSLASTFSTPASSASMSSSSPSPSSSSILSSASSLPSSSASASLSASAPPSSTTGPASSSTISDPPSSSSTPLSSQSTPTTPTTTRSSTSLQTFPSIVFVTSTDSQGHTTVSATSTVILTSAGTVSTVVKSNPTLGSDGASASGSSFFKNTGAVAGVFVLVGLAAAAIVLWVIFGLRRRRRNKRIEHDTAVSATLAAAGLHRTPLDDDELGGISRSPEMGMRAGSALGIGTTGSIPSAGRLSGYLDSPGLEQDAFNPYHEYDTTAPGPGEGYIPARTHSPPPSAPEHPVSHSASHSVGSTEPLLAAFNRASLGSPAPPTPPPRNPKRVTDTQNRRRSTASSVYSVESIADERTNPALRNSDIQDSEDYSRPVLGVRNIPDGDQMSRES